MRVREWPACGGRLLLPKLYARGRDVAALLWAGRVEGKRSARVEECRCRNNSRRSSSRETKISCRGMWDVVCRRMFVAEVRLRQNVDVAGAGSERLWAIGKGVSSRRLLIRCPARLRPADTHSHCTRLKGNPRRQNRTESNVIINKERREREEIDVQQKKEISLQPCRARQDTTQETRRERLKEKSSVRVGTLLALVH